MKESELPSLDQILHFITQRFGHFHEKQVLSESNSSIVIKLSNMNEDKIFRVRAEPRAFIKDQFIYQNFRNVVPVPEIQIIGTINRYYYCLSSYLPGTPLVHYNGEDKLDLIDQSLELLHRLHSQDIEINGFGEWLHANDIGYAHHETMKDFVVTSSNDISLWSDHLPDHVNPSFIQYLLDIIQQKKSYILDISSLLHGDYGYTNVIVDKGIIRGVIDWEHSKIGDPLMDIAWLVLWGNAAYLKRAIHGAYPINWSEESVYHRLKCFLALHTLHSIPTVVGNKTTDSTDYLTRLHQRASKLIDGLLGLEL